MCALAMRRVILGSLNLKPRRRRTSSSSYLQSASLLWAVWALRLGTRGDRLAHWSAQSPRSRPLPGCQEPTRRATVSPKKVTSLSHHLSLNKFSQIFHKFLTTISAETDFSLWRALLERSNILLMSYLLLKSLNFTIVCIMIFFSIICLLSSSSG